MLPLVITNAKKLSPGPTKRIILSAPADDCGSNEQARIQETRCCISSTAAFSSSRPKPVYLRTSIVSRCTTPVG